jgi:hypothetical protein
MSAAASSATGSTGLDARLAVPSRGLVPAQRLERLRCT